MIAEAQVGKDVGTSFVAFLSMAAVFAWFWFGSRNQRALERIARFHAGRPRLRRPPSTVEDEIRTQQRFYRCLALPLAGLLTALTLAFLIKAIVRSI